jgi:glutathione S-transferase
MIVYHWEPNAASARVLIALTEKQLDFESRYVDLLAFDHHQPDYLALNPNAQVPVLVRDGEAFTESSYICEYLDEAFPEQPLMPAEPLARWRARWWQKSVDDYFAQAVSELAWNACHLPSLEGVPAQPPTAERRVLWTDALVGYTPERVAAARERIALTVTEIEGGLANQDWLAGDLFSIGDIAVFSYAFYLPRFAPELVSGHAAPRTSAWLDRMAARPAVREALGMGRSADPYGTTAPGPERIRWG